MKTLVCWMLLGLMSTLCADQKARVTEIRKWYNAIQEGKVTAEKKTKFEAANEPLAGEMTVREYADGLKAITISYSAGDHGGADEHFYYRNGELFFAFLEQGSWRFDGPEVDGQPQTRDTVVEQRIYLEGGKCFRLLRREASARDPKKLEALLNKESQKSVEPDDETAEIIGRGKSLLKAKTDAEVLKVFAADLEPAPKELSTE